MRRCVCAAFCLLTACASPQAEQPRVYDGDWQALMRETPAVQTVQGVKFDCAPFSESFFLRVESGVASGFMQADENYSFTTQVDARGHFRALIPTNSVYTYNGAPLNRTSNIVLVLEGVLSGHDRTGLFVIGDEAIDGQGCATRVQFVAL